MIYYVSLGLFGAGILAFVVFLLVGIRTGSGRLVKFCKNVSEFTANVDSITEENLEQFDAACFSDKTPTLVSEGWTAFKGIRFGYPSEFIDKTACLAGYERKKYNVAALIVMIALYALNVGVLAYSITQTQLASFCSYAIIILPWLLLILLSINPKKRATISLDKALEDLDVSVQLQKQESYKIDTSSLDAIIDIIESVIATEEHKPIPSKKDQLAFSEESQYEETYSEEQPVDTALAEDAPETPVQVELEKQPVDFPKFNSVLNQVIDGKQSKATYLKIAKLMVVAFTKFKDDPEKAAALKDSIRKLIVAYKEAEE